MKHPLSSRPLSRSVGDHPILSGTACVVYGHPSHAIANGVKLRGQLVGVVVRSYNCGSVEVTGVLNTTRRAICRTRRSSKPDHPQRTGPAGAALWKANVRLWRRVAAASAVRRVFIPVPGRSEGDEPARGERLGERPEKLFAEASVEGVHLRAPAKYGSPLSSDDDADEPRPATRVLRSAPAVYGNEVERGGRPREGARHGSRGRRDDALRERRYGCPPRRDDRRVEPSRERRVALRQRRRPRSDFVVPVRRRRRRRAGRCEGDEQQEEGSAAHGTKGRATRGYAGAAPASDAIARPPGV